MYKDRKRIGKETRSQLFNPNARKKLKLYGRGYFASITKNFKKTNLIARGAHGTIFKATDQQDNDLVVKRSIKKNYKFFEMEKQILEECKSKYIVTGLGYGEDENFNYLVLEKLPRTLDDSINELTWLWILAILTQVAEGLQEMHKLGYVYVHLQSKNIMLTKGNEIKIIDFGAATEDGGKTREHHEGYEAPEVFFLGEATPASDVYSFGILAIQLLMKSDEVGIQNYRRRDGRASRASEEESEHIIKWAKENESRYKTYVSTDLQRDKQYCAEGDKAIREILKRCLDEDKEQRPDLTEVKDTLSRCINLAKSKN